MGLCFNLTPALPQCRLLAQLVATEGEAKTTEEHCYHLSLLPRDKVAVTPSEKHLKTCRKFVAVAL